MLILTAAMDTNRVRSGQPATGDKGPAAPIKGKPPTWPSSRAQAVAWLRANNAFGPRHRLVDMLSQALEEVDGGKAFFIRLGTRLVKSRKPTLLAGRNGTFQAFEIPPRQAGKWVSELLTEFKTTAALNEVVEAAPALVLDNLKFDKGAGRDANRKLKGSVGYRKLDNCDGDLVLRLTYMAGDVTRTSYQAIGKGLSEQTGTLAFSFPPLKDVGPDTGPVPVFVEVCAFLNPQRRGKVSVRSTSAAGLVMPGAPD